MPDAPLSRNRTWRRWTRIALGLSVLLDLLLFLFVDLVYNPLALPEPRYRIQLEPPTTRSFSEPVPSLAPNPLPIPSPHTAEMGAMGQAPALGVPGLTPGQGEGVAGQPGVTSGLPGGEHLAGKAPAFVVPEVPLVDHDARLIGKMRQEIAEREKYVRFHVLDADTTDGRSPTTATNPTGPSRMSRNRLAG